MDREKYIQRGQSQQCAQDRRTEIKCPINDLKLIPHSAASSIAKSVDEM